MGRVVPLVGPVNSRQQQAATEPVMSGGPSGDSSTEQTICSQVLGDVNVSEVTADNEAVERRQPTHAVVCKVHRVQVVVAGGAEQRAGELVERRRQDDQVDAVAEIQVAAEQVVADEQVRQGAGGVGDAQVIRHVPC